MKAAVVTSFDRPLSVEDVPVPEPGPEPHGLEIGARVALPWLGYSCGDCRHCNSGRRGSPRDRHPR